FSWDVIVGNNSYCWFGGQHCLTGYGPTTVLQYATIAPADLGTSRKSRLALTFVSECSNVNNNGFITTNATTYLQNITHGSKNGSIGYELYNFGKTLAYAGLPPDLRNATFILFDS